MIKAALLALMSFFAIAPASAQTINMMSYLVQNRCQQIGKQQFCFAPQQRGDAAYYERRDWPGNGYMASDSVQLGPTQAAQIYRFGPNFDGPFNPAIGDGGQFVIINGNSAIGYETRDGGTPTDQYFVGPNCGGTGWVFFRDNVPNGSWASEIATLSDASDPGSCPPLGQAYTQYTLATFNFPFLSAGSEVAVPVSAVISEHYDGESVAGSQNMERFYFAQGWGFLAWQAWSSTAAPTVDLVDRCPAIGYGTPPNSAWHLVDCRVWSNIVPLNGSWNADYFAWPWG